MNDREKVQKAFNQCSDALSNLDQNAIMKVFHLLSVQFDIVTPSSKNDSEQKGEPPKFLPSKPTDASLDPKNNPKISLPKKAKGSSNKSLQFLTDYDFRPSGKETLIDFCSRYKGTTNLENNLIFAYYLQEIVKEPAISSDHIFSCYRHLGFKLPSFPSTLNDTSRLKGWIDASNTNNIRVTRSGINHLEHSFNKNGE